MPKKFLSKGQPASGWNSEGGALPILILLAALGLLAFLLISNTAGFKDKLFSSLFPKPPSHAAEVNPPSVPDEILLKFKPGVTDKAKENIRNSHGIKVEEIIKQIDVERGKVPAEARDRVIQALKKNPQVEYAEPNFLGKLADIPNDPCYSGCAYGSYSHASQWFLPKIGAPSAWDINKGNSSIVVAIIDSGVDSTHEDLVGKLIPGYNFYDNNTDTSDVTGHGTAVVGTAGAATNNGKGVASLGRDVSVMPLKVTTSDGAPVSSAAAQALSYAADHGARVANLSMELPTSNTVQDAVNYAWSKGMVIVAATGNESCSCMYYPAAANNVVAVGATTDLDAKASFSNTGPQLDVMAPGISIFTTGVGNIYGYSAGTSLSSPQVAALAALIFSANPNLTNQQVVDTITSTALDLGTAGWDDQFGWGRIQADKALQKATGITPPPPDTTSPTVSISSPTGGTVSGLVDITASASDNVGVTKVEFYIDGTLFATDITSPFLASWDTTLYSNSSHTLLVKAYDLANNVGTSSSVTITVGNISPTLTLQPTPTSTPAPSDTTLPVVSITSPLNGSIVKTSSKVTITANASDNIKVTKVEFYVGNTLKCSVLSGAYTCTWSVPGKKNISYTISVKAYDPSNNTQSATIKVTAQ